MNRRNCVVCVAFAIGLKRFSSCAAYLFYILPVRFEIENLLHIGLVPPIEALHGWKAKLFRGLHNSGFSFKGTRP